ncbi:MAG: phosphoribosyltransferase family protein [Balneolales bacterium]
MEYRSFADMGRTVTMNLYKIPNDIDLIVGIPRSGLLAGNLIALSLNIPIIDLDGFIENRKPRHGFTRKTKTSITTPREAKNVMVVDDTILSGRSMNHVREIIHRASIDQQITYCTVYADPRSREKVDIYLEELTSPRSFEWNIMHNSLLEECCIDIDGVLCKDPTKKENDDGSAYRKFLLNAKPLTLPSRKIGYLVTSRLEKYRKETEAWLSKHNIFYKRLHMLDLPDSKTRRRLSSHAGHKARIFRSYPDSPLFIESERGQAIEISRLTGRVVLCFSDQKLYTPVFSAGLVEQKIKSYPARAVSKAKRIAWHLIDSSGLNRGSKPAGNTPQPSGPMKKENTAREIENGFVISQQD